MSQITGAMMPPGGAGPGPSTDGPQMTGKSTDGDFEKSFSDIAFAYVQDKTPQLNKFLVGFQILDRDEEGYRAVGIFGYKIQNRELFIPVFFLKGELKGLDLIYVKDRDIFVPLEENWINYLINKKNILLGSGVERDTAQFGPDLSAFFRSPSKNYKMASKATNLFSLRDSQKPYKDQLDLKILAETAGREVFVKFCYALMQKPDLAETIGKFYEPEHLQKIASQIENRIYFSAPEVTVISSHEDPKAIFLDESDREKLARRQNVYIDKRATARTSEIIMSDGADFQLQNPDHSGIHSYLTQDADFKDVFISRVFLDKKRIASQNDPYENFKPRDVALVIDPKEKVFFYAYGKALWVKGTSNPTDFDKWFRGLDSISSISVNPVDCPCAPEPVCCGGPEELSKDSYYVLISPKGYCSTPFKVNTKTERTDGTTNLDVSWHYCSSSSIFGETEPVNYTGRRTLKDWMEKVDSKGSFSNGNGSIILTDNNSPNATMVGQALVVPGNFKVILVKELYSKNTYNPGDVTDIYMQVKKLASEYFTPFDLYVDSGEFRISTPLGTSAPLYGERFVRDLVMQHGLTEKAARDLSAILVKKGSLKTFVKYAAGYPMVKGAQLPFLMGNGMSAPQQPMDNYSYNHLRGYREDSGQNSFELPIVNPEADQSRPGLENDDEQLIMQAASTGQKQILDTAILGSMVRSFNSQELVDRFLPDLINGMDRIGRILFFFYWHNDDFIERYGSEEIPELEEGLKNVFKGLGDLILFLQQKAVISANFGELSLSDIQ